MSHQELIALSLLLAANGTPVLVSLVLKARWRRPLDGGWKLFDSRPLFGPSKTVVGLVSALLASAFLGMLLGLDWWLGLLFGAFAMVGDLLSSFIKRRAGLPSSAVVLGLDQVPESLLPLMACASSLEISWTQVMLVTAAFFVLDLILSRIAFHSGLRKQP